MAANEARKLIQQQKNVQRQLKEFIVVAGVEAKNHFVKSFSNQGFTDETLVKWTPRKRNTDRGRYILVKSGNLRRSIRIMSRSLNAITIGSDLPYAAVHNDGGRIRRGRMPKRQFIGSSAVLNKTILSRLDKLINKSFR